LQDRQTLYIGEAKPAVVRRPASAGKPCLEVAAPPRRFGLRKTDAGHGAKSGLCAIV